MATIVAKASGMPFETYVKEHIFEPAEMGSVVYDYVPGIDPDMPERVFGYKTELDGSRTFEDKHFEEHFFEEIVPWITICEDLLLKKQF